MSKILTEFYLYSYGADKVIPLYEVRRQAKRGVSEDDGGRMRKYMQVTDYVNGRAFIRSACPQPCLKPPNLHSQSLTGGKGTKIKHRRRSFHGAEALAGGGGNASGKLPEYWPKVSE